MPGHLAAERARALAGQVEALAREGRLDAATAPAQALPVEVGRVLLALEAAALADAGREEKP